MNIKWLIHRLSVMSLSEILYRTKNTLKFKLIESKLIKSSSKDNIYIDFNYIKKVLFDFGCGKTNYSISDNLKDVSRPDETTLYQSDECIQEILISANNALNNKIDVFGDMLTLPDNFDWQTDPTSNRSWSRDFFLRIDYRNADCPGDPKIIWEINRHQFLVDLGIAYQVTGNEKYAEKILNIIASWIHNNKQYYGINWTSSLELALRLWSWLISISLISKSNIFNAWDKNKINYSIYCQADFIFNYMSLYSSANNHLIGELTGLLLVSFFLKGTKKTERWKKKAIFLLEQQIDKQFFNDGVNKEQAIYYECYTIEYYLLCEYLLKAFNQSFSPKVYLRLGKSIEFLHSISTKNGLYPNIGDEDGGYGLRVGKKENKILSLLSLASVLFDKNYLIGKRKLFDLKSLLLLSNKYSRFFMELHDGYEPSSGIIDNSSGRPELKIFKEGGYAILKKVWANEDTLITFDFGPIGLRPLSAHGHADILSINLIHKGKPILADIGTYKYYQDNNWRTYFKSTAAHNTICVEDSNQLDELGSFLWGKEPHIGLSFNEKDLWIEAEHDGYLKNFGVVHKRRLEYYNNSLIITDTIKTSQRRQISMNFHLDKQVTIEKITNGKFKLTNSHAEAIIEFDHKLGINIKKGVDAKERTGWISERFNSITPTNSIIAIKSINKDEIFITKITLI
ncbi:MAG: alginate lyase family protein [Bacillota bacterium]|nr:alginate lyase family protein [Bacillota bacterium]